MSENLSSYYNFYLKTALRFSIVEPLGSAITAKNSQIYALDDRTTFTSSQLPFRAKQIIMQKFHLFLLSAFFFLSATVSLSAQIGGNRIYGNQSVRYDRTPVQTTSIQTTDSLLTVTAKVLLNQRAAYYILTVGVQQTGKTVAEVNRNINARISGVLDKMQDLGVDKEDFYVDFISNTKNYDHTVVDREIREFFDGFNMRKNIIFKIYDLSVIDQIINICAEAEIYDIIKVDYVSEDLETINKNLFAEAIKIAEKKKVRFEKNSSIKVTNNYRLTSEKFQVYYPKDLYKQYNEAFESSVVEVQYNSNFLRKNVRKERTFYYEGPESDTGFDKISDKISPVVGIQYAMTVQVVYELKER